MSDAVVVRGLVKRYRKASSAAVDDVSFTVRAGSFFALLGPNGAGKTTTLSVLTTTLVPTSGEVQVAEADAIRAPGEVRRKIGIVFQKPSLDANLTGEQNVRLHAVMYGVYPYRPTYGLMPADYRREVDALAQLLGIGDALRKPVRTLSGGMQRKLELVRSLLHRPDVLFLDEPTAGLDPESRRDLWAYLRETQRESGTTMVLTTHYLEEAESADAVTVLTRGKVVAEGTPAELMRRLGGRQTLLLDAEDRDALARELGPTASGSGPFVVDADDRQVQELLQRLRTPLTLVRTTAPTLEDAYLDIVKADEDA